MQGRRAGAMAVEARPDEIHEGSASCPNHASTSGAGLNAGGWNSGEQLR